jgi:hypothetical protein
MTGILHFCERLNNPSPFYSVATGCQPCDVCRMRDLCGYLTAS